MIGNILCVIFGIIVGVFTAHSEYKVGDQTLKQITKLQEECERNYPRYVNCVPTVTFEPVGLPKVDPSVPRLRSINPNCPPQYNYGETIPEREEYKFVILGEPKKKNLADDFELIPHKQF